MQAQRRLQDTDMGFGAGQDDLWATGCLQQWQNTGLCGAGKMRFLEKAGVDRRRPDCRQAGPQAPDILFRDKGGDLKQAGPFEQADAVGDHRVSVMNRRRELCLQVDDQQEAAVTLDQAHRKTTVLLPCTSTRSSRW